jgi:hypothetical protein
MFEIKEPGLHVVEIYTCPNCGHEVEEFWAEAGGYFYYRCKGNEGSGKACMCNCSLAFQNKPQKHR